MLFMKEGQNKKKMDIDGIFDSIMLIYVVAIFIFSPFIIAIIFNAWYIFFNIETLLFIIMIIILGLFLTWWRLRR
jgi:hypothetical protein